MEKLKRVRGVFFLSSSEKRLNFEPIYLKDKVEIEEEIFCQAYTDLFSAQLERSKHRVSSFLGLISTFNRNFIKLKKIK